MHVDTLVKNVRVYNAYTQQFIASDVAIDEGRFVAIGHSDELESIQANTIIDGQGQQMIPGLIDIHLHIESSMVTPETFSWALLRNGVTTIVAEPHEMANVFGIEGIKAMIEASAACTVDMKYAIPSSVPATSLETTGGAIGIAEMDELMTTEDIQCLGEIMNYVDVLSKPDSKTNQILKHFRRSYPALPIEGHVPKLTGLDLHQIVAAGIGSDHTHQTREGMEARIKAGMFLEIQEKSMTDDVLSYLIENDTREHFCFVTDDVMADSLYKRGHLNVLANKALAAGMKFEDVIYACTMAPAKRMKLDDRGAIAPGKIADFSLLAEDGQFVFSAVYKDGMLAFDAASPYKQTPKPRQFPPHFYESVKLAPLQDEDFHVVADRQDGIHVCRVMNVADGSTFTKETQEKVPVANGLLQWQDSDFRLIATFERYGKTGGRAHGLIAGDIIQRGAVATTYSHDNHNLLVIGANVRDMVCAANAVIQAQGGCAAVENGEVKAMLELPVGGILSEAPLTELAPKVESFVKALTALGYKHYNPIMSLSTLSLPVSPALKITDFGLIDVNNGKVVPLFVNEKS